MKKLTKILVLILVLSLFCAMTAFCVGAEELTGTTSEETPEAPSETEGVTDEDSFFSLLFDAIASYSSEIMSALSLIGSLIIAFAYKSGLTPMLRGALGGMMNSVNALKEGVAEGDARLDKMNEALNARLAENEKSIDEMSRLMPELSELARAASAEDGMKRELSILLTEQINMLYDIFMSSGLPQYRKDEVGERVAVMRRLIASEGKDGDA